MKSSEFTDGRESFTKLVLFIHLFIFAEIYEDMRKFDSRGRNTLNFPDFLDFMARYEEPISTQRKKTLDALEHFQTVRINM